MAYFGSIFFANMGDGGGQNCFQKGSETLSFPRSEHEERGSLRPFSPSQEGVSDPFSGGTAKGETSYIPKSP